MKSRLKMMIVVTCVMVVVLTGCSDNDYNVNKSICNKPFMGGYFTLVEEWQNEIGTSNFIAYANDTKVMYYFFQGLNGLSGVTPLYNTDGTLQIYKE